MKTKQEKLGGGLTKEDLYVCALCFKPAPEPSYRIDGNRVCRECFNSRLNAKKEKKTKS